ncbi:hypothetical protein IRJ41_025295 [Triplophysa rosa]|uniref:Uncharacterized protein n=1 Tax=Triplophysa rosa TaxID=992332 RepID=A0A9W7WB95_TRIRA|nr:hypothetical protein IRJ41_025295 [Triplophysa rosa]
MSGHNVIFLCCSLFSFVPFCYGNLEEWFLGRALRDEEPTIIHHTLSQKTPPASAILTSWLAGPSAAPWLSERVNYEPAKSDFSIDLQHEIGLYIWEEGTGPVLTAANEFCSEPHDTASTKYDRQHLLPHLRRPSNEGKISCRQKYIILSSFTDSHEPPPLISGVSPPCSTTVPVVKQTWGRRRCLV